MLTDLTSEFTHFNPVIHLSKAKLSAFLLSTVFDESRCSCSPRVFSPRFLSARVKPFWTARNLRFCSNFCSYIASCHDTSTRQAHDVQVWSFSFWWLSGEVKHIVHLIRWNLIAVFMPLWLTWTRACCGTIARPLGLGTESCCLTNCFGFLVCHQLVPHLVPNFPRVPLRNVSWGLGVCAVLVRSVSPCRLVPEVRLFPSPPALFLAVCPSCVRFFLPLAFQGWPGSDRVCVCNI